jgi:hypothetical protein
LERAWGAAHGADAKLEHRHRWLPDFSKIRARCGIRSTSAKTSKSPRLCVLSCTALRSSDRFTAAVLIRQRHLLFWTTGDLEKQAARFQDLLQQPSHAYLTGRANAGYAGVTTNRKSPLVSMAAPLPILVSTSMSFYLCASV